MVINIKNLTSPGDEVGTNKQFVEGGYYPFWLRIVVTEILGWWSCHSFFVNIDFLLNILPFSIVHKNSLKCGISTSYAIRSLLYMIIDYLYAKFNSRLVAIWYICAASLKGPCNNYVTFNYIFLKLVV